MHLGKKGNVSCFSFINGTPTTEGVSNVFRYRNIKSIYNISNGVIAAGAEIKFRKVVIYMRCL